MIGKTILDSIGWTEELGGTIQPKIEPIVQMNTKRFDKFKADLDKVEKDPVQVDLYLKTHGLKQVEELKDYILNNDIKQNSVNELITQQNYQNIANQAHGINGVQQAIDEYTNSLVKFDDGTTKASDNTNKFIKVLSESNPKLASCMANAEGSKIGLGSYAKSLVTATAKTFLLEADTTTLNAIMSMGIFFLVSGAVSLLSSWVDNVIHAIEKIREASGGFIESIQSFHNEIADGKTKLADIADRYNAWFKYLI